MMMVSELSWLGRRWSLSCRGARLFTRSTRRFRDHVTLRASAGNGGVGCVSFHRLLNGKKGRADGGNGGDGGDIRIIAHASYSSLQLPSYHLKATSGTNGGPRLLHGRRGNDCIVYVPLGTVVTLHQERASDDSSDWMRMFNGAATNADIIETKPDTAAESTDLLRNNEEVLVAKGGRGGAGNRSSQIRVDKNRPAGQASAKGRPGQTVKVDIELKVLADVGLVGYPNAGKSTLLAAMSKAKPKVDSYAFTMLSPNLGVVDANDKASRLMIADIPGLVEGAHRNRGLGHDFLRHIERTKILVYVVDLAGTEDRCPAADFRSVRDELRLYQKELLSRPSVVFANKAADDNREAWLDNLQKLKAATELPIITGSARARLNLDALRERLFDLKRELDAVEARKAADTTTKTAAEFPFLYTEEDEAAYELEQQQQQQQQQQRQRH